MPVLRLYVFITAVLACLAGKAKDKDGETRRLLKEVDTMVVEGRSKYGDAVNILDKILESEPENTKVLYKRAEVNDLLRKSDVALVDLNKLLKLKPDSKQAYQLRSKILTRTGDFEAAWKDWDMLRQIYEKSKSKYEKGKKLQEATDKRNMLHHLARDVREMEAMLASDPENEVNNQVCMEVMERMMKEARDRQDEYRLRRIDCALAAKFYDVANDELVRVLTMDPHNLDAIHLKAMSLKMMGATDAALSNVKRCLSLDPEHKECKKLHKSIKKYNKLAKRFEEHVMDKEWDRILEVVEESFAADANPFNADRLHFYKCKAHLSKRMLDVGVASCTTAIGESGGDNPAAWELFVMRADLHMLAGNLDDAEEDLEKAQKLQPNEWSIRDKQTRLEKLKKQAARKDYYKILGVARTAEEKEIKRAFRKLAMVSHPDKLSGLDAAEMEAAEVRYKDMSEAYQVLSDPEKRQRYDLGEDIEDQPQHHHHHHHQGFHFHQHGGGGGGFQGGGFNFRFR